MSKRKSTDHKKGGPMSIELDEDQIAAFERLSVSLHHSLQSIAPILDSIRKTYGDEDAPHKKSLPTRQATDFKSTAAVAHVLGIDSKEEYDFSLKSEHLQGSKQLSEHIAAVVKDLKSSDYVRIREDESFCRTILDLILLDRLRHLKDKDVFYHLQVSAKVPLSIRVTDMYGNSENIKGRADWAVGYGSKKSDTGAILLIIEAKPFNSVSVGMPQLLIYMAAVYEARKGRNKTNNGVFGILSDSKEFYFAFLNESKKFSTSRAFKWGTEQPTILAYIDMMLLNAIDSSPHTTPTKKDNLIINRYPTYFRSKWNFGTLSDDEEFGDEEDEEDDDADMVDVIRDGDHITTVSRSKRAGRSKSPA